MPVKDTRGEEQDWAGKEFWDRYRAHTYERKSQEGRMEQYNADVTVSWKIQKGASEKEMAIAGVLPWAERSRPSNACCVWSWLSSVCEISVASAQNQRNRPRSANSWRLLAACTYSWTFLEERSRRIDLHSCTFSPLFLSFPFLPIQTKFITNCHYVYLEGSFQFGLFLHVSSTSPSNILSFNLMANFISMWPVTQGPDSKGPFI